MLPRGRDIAEGRRQRGKVDYTGFELFVMS